MISSILLLLSLIVGDKDCFANAKHKDGVCGVLDSFEGDVQILDSSREKLLNVSSRSTVDCGAWISVNQGWAKLRHVNGQHIHLGNHTLLQLTDFHHDAELKGDHSILYKGEIFVSSKVGEEEFHILTAGARVRVKSGQIVVVYDAVDDQTQLIALSKSAFLENRFESSRQVKVNAGESSLLNFKLLRVIPLIPTAVSVTGLKTRLLEMQVSEQDRTDGLQAALLRQNRRFASTLDSDRKPASVGKIKARLRNSEQISDPILKKHIAEKLIGSDEAADEILFPNSKNKKEEDKEKKRLLESLSEIHSE